MNGDFLRDVGEGIFGRLRDVRREQEDKDFEQKKQTLGILSTLMSQAEPDSQPALMRHMGDVIGVKGKLKGFWDAFSGMPDRSIEDQLGTSLRGVMSKVTGPGEAKRVRAGGDLARLFQPEDSEQEANRASRLGAERDLQDRIILRDPRAEEIEEIRTRYGSQLQKELTTMDERHKNDLNLQAERLRLQGIEKNLAYERKKVQTRDTLAGYYLDTGRAKDENQAKIIASDYLFNKSEADLDAIRALSGMRGAIEAKSKAEAKALQSTGGLAPSEVRQRAKLFQDSEESFKKATGLVEGLRAKQTTTLNSINTLINRFPGYKFRFDPDKGEIQFLEAPPGVNPGDAKFYTSRMTQEAQGLLKEYADTQRQIKTAEGEAAGFEKSMKEYEKFKPKTPVKPSRPTTPKSKGDVGKVGMGTTKGLRRFKPKSGVEYVPNETEVFIDGRKHMVIGFDPDGTIVAQPME